MLGLKKYVFHNELLHLTILLSLLRIDPDAYIHLDHGIEVSEIMLGSSSAYIPTQMHNIHNRLSGYAHPKNLDNLLLNHQFLFNELNQLGRYNRFDLVDGPREIATYLLNAQEPLTVDVEDVQNEANDSGGPVNLPEREEIPVSSEEETPVEDDVREEATASTASQLFPNWGEMSKEDMDLIEILLRQDIDLGVTREVFDVQHRKDTDKIQEDPIEALKLSLKDEKTLETPPVCDPWSGLNYTIDSETGEHVVLDDGEEAGASDSDSVLAGPSLTSSDLLSLPEELDNIPFEELGLSLPLEELSLPDDEPKEINKEKDDESIAEIPESILRFDRQNSFSEQLRELEDMIQTAQLHHAHPGRGLQTRGPYLRSVSMEQRWQDLTNLLSIPTASEAEMHHHHHHYHHNMSMGMLHGAGHVPQHNYSIPSYATIDNRTVLLQNATLPPPVADINSNMSYQSDVGGDPSAISSAVVTSMGALTNSSDPLVDSVHHGHYQMDSGVMMFPSNHTEVNQTTEGFLSAILNDEDLQLMDMAMNEGDSSFTLPVSRKSNGTEHVNDVHPVHVGMYTMRMLDNEDAMDTSSDSAVSSMGSSERVPSISDGEWMETASESSHPDDQDRYYGMECTQSKFRQYNYSYAPGMAPGQRANVPTAGSDGGSASLDRRMPPVAQKKYQLFGKRLPVEQSMGGSPYGTLPRGNATMPQPTNVIKYPDYIYPSPQDHNSSSSYGSLEGATAPNSSMGSVEQKYSCRVEFTRQQSVEATANLEHIQHNHTYQLSSENMHDMQRPTIRDKQKKKLAEEHLSRDEKRARSMKLPLTSEEIINLPMDEFNERLSKYDLTEAQLALIRDIRRRGKNKVAAQNCRKRKLDQILLLAEEVQGMQREREQLIHDNHVMVGERQRLKDKFSQLYRHVFQSLRDPDGNPYSPYDYSLQQAADGNILLVPRNGTTNMELDPSKGAKNKRKEEDKK